MDYICQHCSANLDGGDIFEYFFLKYNDYEKAIQIAKRYGWSETNKIHFNRSRVIQYNNRPQCTICPDCQKNDPFPNK